MKIAVCGKGGTGKSTVVATLASWFKEASDLISQANREFSIGKKVLAGS